MRPVIAITCGFEPTRDAESPAGRVYLATDYSDAVLAAGGLAQPLPVPPTPDPALIDELLARVDGLLFTGGADLDPQEYGEPAHPKTAAMHPRRQQFELELFRRADAADIPILAICLGFQVAHVARGGRLIQHVDDLALEPPVTHHLSAGQSAFHSVRIEPGSRLADVVGSTEIEVNSRHHQAVDRQRPGHGLRSVGFAPDGLLEASEDRNRRFLLAVQWHPENLIDRPEHLRLFQALVAAAARK
jgi:gamma-glutamyl-gamma-aminobutyrate hydrolase PuuD